MSGDNATAQTEPYVPILMYHEIAARPETASRLAVSPDQFAAQVGYLHDAGFSTLTFTEAAEAAQANERWAPALG